jgi:hypothetical protein
VAKYYNIWDMVGLEEHHPFWPVVSDCVLKYHYFEPPGKAPVRIEISSESRRCSGISGTFAAPCRSRFRPRRRRAWKRSGCLAATTGETRGLLCGKTDRDAIDWINAVDWLEQLNFR